MNIRSDRYMVTGHLRQVIWNGAGVQPGES